MGCFGNGCCYGYEKVASLFMVAEVGGRIALLVQGITHDRVSQTGDAEWVDLGDLCRLIILQSSVC